MSSVKSSNLFAAGKATGPDMISTEMMQALEGIELDAITKMLNTIYDTGEIPKEMLQSTFIVLQKKKQKQNKERQSVNNIVQ